MSNMNGKYIVNSNYILKNDDKRIYLTYRHNSIFSSPLHYDADANFFSYIHPEQAKIFALFDGNKELSVVIDEVAEKLNLTRERAVELIMPFIENKKRLSITFQQNKFVFPTNFLVPKKKEAPVYLYKQTDFVCNELEFSSPRINTFPLDITLMLNTICMVDCIYCYADCRKKTDCQIPVKTLDKLITDCEKNKVRAFNLMGGEVLLYKNWKWLVKRMFESGYTPYISTKIPIGNDIVQELHDLGIRLFQISLDSFDGNILEKNLNIPHGDKYISKMRKTFKHFEDIGLKLNIHAVITQHNKEVSHLQQYLDEVSKFSNVSNVKLSIVGESLYKEGYHNHKLNLQDVRKIADFVNSVRASNTYPFNISFSSGAMKDGFTKNKELKKESYKNRALCSANVMQAFILPTGEVTICEELMFNPNFILGNINDHDLGTIWKNNKLHSLGNNKLYRNSNCGKCKEFTLCRSAESKRGICWKEVLHAYGEEKWNYPDPKCPYAPVEMNPFYIE